MAQERKGFMCYRSFRDAINELPIEERLQVYEAIVDYALDKIEPDTAKMSGAVRMAWKLIRPTLDADWTRWQNGCQGGAPAGNQNARKQPRNNRKTYSASVAAAVPPIAMVLWYAGYSSLTK